MAWLRLDDGYDSHPKILQLTESERWRWTRVLIHCARHRTQGSITKAALTDTGLGRVIPKLLQVGLLDETDDPSGTYTVHDWDDFNPKDPTNADRQRRHRNALRNTDRNGTVTENVTESDTTEALQNRDSRAATRARSRPVLERDKSLSTGVTLEHRDTDDLEDARHNAWTARAQAPDVRSPQAFINAGMRTGGWPDPPPLEQQRVTVNGSAADDAGCPSCGVGGGKHAGDCEQAVDLVVETNRGYAELRASGEAADELDVLEGSLADGLDDGDNRTEEQ